MPRRTYRKANKTVVAGLVVLGVVVGLAVGAVLVALATSPSPSPITVWLVLAGVGVVTSAVGLLAGLLEARAAGFISIILAIILGAISLLPAPGIFTLVSAVLGYAAVVLFIYGGFIIIFALLKSIVELEARLEALEARQQQ